jgi:DNA polymerase type B, organellar and viral
VLPNNVKEGNNKNKMTQLNYQNYKHYKLPITMNPLEYGKLIYQNDNVYIIQITIRTIAVLTQFNDLNEVKFYKEGDLIFNYKDHKTDENTFVRSLNNNKFTFTDNKLVSTNRLINRYNWLINSVNNLGIRRFSTIPKNIIKLRKVSSKYIWKNIIFNINNKPFSKSSFDAVLSNFWNKIESEFTENNHLFILLKIKYNNGQISTIGTLQRINKNDKNWYLNFILGTLRIKSEYYSETQMSAIIFDYGFKNKKIEDKVNLIKPVNFQNYKNYNLPISMDPLDYNVLSSQKGISYIFRQFEKYNEVEIINDGISLIKYIDHFINEKAFIRKIGNKTFYFENGVQTLFKADIKTKFISKTQKTKNLTNNIITLDIETYIDETNTLIPYLICFYDGKDFYSFGLWDYNSSEQMILDCLNSILIRKYNGYKVYIHNMAKFDIIFLLKYLVKVGIIHPIIHNGRIISININYGENNGYQIQFKDSYLILLNSLMKLCKAFSVEDSKSFFPHLFVNKNNLNYIGKVPAFKYFIKTNKEDYKNYVLNLNSLWSLKDEAVKYCRLDCISLYQILINFNSMIFELFGKNVHHYPTLPSLAFAIFRTNFMREENIPQLSGKIASDIRQGYTGGAVDMYIPKPPNGVKIKGYDVNSLYPSQMFDQLMPIGLPTYFEGDIRAIDSNAFGFFYCEIIAPDNIKHPIIQTHVKINSTKITMAPIGTWSDMIFSEEMDNAIKYGYKFNILWGYTFNRDNIFKDYVEYLYSLRLNYPKSDPLNYIAKILLNSLYGRFGMDDNFTEVNIIHKDFYSDFENRFFENILQTQDLGDYKLVTYKTFEEIEDEESTHNVSIGIASAITGYSRIHMSQFKNNPEINLYYTDTDSVYTDSNIDENLIDAKILGKLKLENICKDALFLAPKMYCLLTEDNELIYKVKGLKHEVELTMKDFDQLLYKDVFIKKSQTKWMRDLSLGKIKLLESVYTLKVTDNKRELIYNKYSYYNNTYKF